MYSHSSVSSHCRSSSVDQHIPTDGSPSSSSWLHQIYAWTKMPVMVTKTTQYRGLPDQPDRAGMRERSAQRDMSLIDLQRSCGIEPPDNPHTAMLEAYGYGQLAQLVMGIPQVGASVLHAISSAMNFRIGPPGASAAPVRVAKASSSEVLSVGEFVKKHSRDFEIWLSVSAKKATDMKGMIIVVGEHHYDEKIQKQIARLMLYFRNLRALKLFSEGGEDGVCELRLFEFGLENIECSLLEADFPPFQAIRDGMEDFRGKLERAVAFLHRHVPTARAGSQASVVHDEMLEFIRKHQRGVPAKFVTEYNRLAIEVQKASDLMVALVKAYDPQKESWMSQRLRSDRDMSAINLAIVGAIHLNGMLDKISNLPCMFMNLKSLAERFPETALPEASREEL